MPLFYNNFNQFNQNQRQNFSQGNFNGYGQNNRTIFNNGSLFSRLFSNRQNQNLGQIQNPMFSNMPSNIPNNMPNNMPSNIPNNMPSNMQNNIPSNMMQDGISFKHLTEEELEKINEEIQENIEKNKVQVFPINNEKDESRILKYLREFIQDEENSNIFYTALANNCNNTYYRERLKNIREDCITCKDLLKNYYKNLKNEDFETENLRINTNVSFKQGLHLAMEEEIKGYDKICEMIEEFPAEDTKRFYKIAFKKLSRINFIQHMQYMEMGK